MISKRCTYALQMVTYLAEREGAYVPVRAISDELAIPRSFLAKVAGTLARAGILVALRGPTGGVALARDSYEINVHDIITVVDGGDLFTECVLGLPGCGEAEPCPLHATWGGVRSGLGATFSQISIRDLIGAGAAACQHCEG